MREVKPAGVKRLSLDECTAAAVEVIAEERMAKMREMYANLVRAARVEDEAHQGETSVCTHGLIMRACFLSVRGYFAQDDARQRAGNRRVDKTGRWRELSFYNSEIFAVEEFAFPAFGRQLVLDLRDLGDEHEA